MAKEGVDSRYVRLGEVVRAARDRHGLSQAELAAKIGRQQSWLSKCERGDLEMGVFAFLDLASALN